MNQEPQSFAEQSRQAKESTRRLKRNMIIVLVCLVAFAALAMPLISLLEKLEAAEGGGAVSLIYYDQVTVDLSDNKVYLRFDNPSKSVNNMTLEISIKDTVLAKSGALQPGYRLTELPLQAGVAEKLAAGYAYVDGAKYTIYYYDPTTGERAIVNTEIPITVTVQE